MRIHTTATERNLHAAGFVAGVQFERLDRKGSKSHDHAFDVILSGSSGRRGQAGNDNAATWDEWGIFLAALYRYDPNMKIGSASWGYADADDFRHKTGARFDTLTPAQQHKRHKWTHYGTPFEFECSECDAIMRHR